MDSLTLNGEIDESSAHWGHSTDGGAKVSKEIDRVKRSVNNTRNFRFNNIGARQLQEQVVEYKEQL